VPEGESVDRGWTVLEVMGPLDFSLSGVVASLVVPLAEAALPIFVISTFESDYVLIRSSDLARAADAPRGGRSRVRRLTLQKAPPTLRPMTSVRTQWAWRTERGGSLRAR